MAATKTEPVVMNVRQKLARARLLFLQRNIGKSGKNIKLEFKYFELSDIVPSAIEIFAELGLTTSFIVDGDKVIFTVYNTDNLEEAGLDFVLPYREVDIITNREGKAVTNPIQALGASITYLRRYLWMLVLDIAEHDEIDEKEALPLDTKTRSTAPATQEQRTEAKKELTSAPDASEDQIQKLKGICKELLTKDATQEDFINQIAMKTEGFTVIDADKCEALIAKLTEVLKQYT